MASCQCLDACVRNGCLAQAGIQPTLPHTPAAIRTIRWHEVLSCVLCGCSRHCHSVAAVLSCSQARFATQSHVRPVALRRSLQSAAPLANFTHVPCASSCMPMSADSDPQASSFGPGLQFQSHYSHAYPTAPGLKQDAIPSATNHSSLNTSITAAASHILRTQCIAVID